MAACCVPDGSAMRFQPRERLMSAVCGLAVAGVEVFAKEITARQTSQNEIWLFAGLALTRARITIASQPSIRATIITRFRALSSGSCFPRSRDVRESGQGFMAQCNSNSEPEWSVANQVRLSRSYVPHPR